MQDNLRFGCDNDTADRISCFNRHYAEHSGYAFSPRVSWLQDLNANSEGKSEEPTVYYDSVMGKPLFKAPINRTLA